ncbi:glycosyltransferase family 1 protein [Lentibacillus sediminis]|uniref:glycosyltransferase family 1 protein n=1 Tax=Lentibacillus sediminis TaxID=1940529 RepID=UPI000C1BF62C|nr:glycosyltransferase family 1 protein [Lentibacillus sediminis]
MGSPIRILHVVVNMNRGGAETLIMNLYRNINREKIQFDFLTCNEGAFDEEISRMGGKIHRIPYVTEAGPIGFSREIIQFLNRNPYKIIHSHLDRMSGLVLKSAKKAGVPVRIAHSHNTGSEGGFVSKTFKWYAGSHIPSNATHFYACSLGAASWLFKHHSKKAFILKNGIEPDKFQFSTEVREETRRTLNLGPNQFVLGHIGRFNKQKNHLYLLDVFRNVSKQIPKAVLILVGDGALKGEIKEKIMELNLEEKVKLLGIRDDTHKLLQAFDLFVFPSLHEGLPVSLIEAQGAGLPCLISNRITKEVDMGLGLVEQLSLGRINSWVERIHHLSQERNIRWTDEQALQAHGYDIRRTAEFAQSSYLSLGMGDPLT